MTLSILVLLFVGATCSLNAEKHSLPMPFANYVESSLFQSTKTIHLSHTSPNNLSYPVWPVSFNATLAKIDPESKHPIYTKLYFDGDYSRFYFYDHYYNLNGTWGDTFYEVLFTKPNIFYHIYPKERKCDISPSRIPNLSTHWLKDTKFVGYEMIRGVYCECWMFDNGLRYYTYTPPSSWPTKPFDETGANGVEKRVPIRSINQKEDPGATDFSDLSIGPQDSMHWRIPDYCPPPPSQ